MLSYFFFQVLARSQDLRFEIRVDFIFFFDTLSILFFFFFFFFSERTLVGCLRNQLTTCDVIVKEFFNFDPPEPPDPKS